MASAQMTEEVSIMATLQKVWQTMGMELITFIVTLVFAILLRSTSFKPTQKASQKKPKRDMKEDSSPEPPRRQVPRSSGDASAPTRVREPRKAAQEKVQDRAALVDEICEHVKTNLSMRAATHALELYGKLFDSSLEDSHVPIVELVRRCKNTANEFYSTVVNCAIRVGKPQLVDKIIDDMHKQGVAREISFYESTMKQLAGQKNFEMALSVYDRMTADGLEPSSVTCSCLVSFAVEVGDLGRAVKFFDQLASMTVPSIRAYMTILRVHNKRQDWPASLKTMQDMKRLGAPVDNLVLNVILATGVVCDQIEAVEQLVNDAISWDPPVVDVVSFNTLIKGLCQRNLADKAILVISRMKDYGITPNAISFNTAMDAAVRSSKAKDAWSLLRDMRASGISPDKFTASILIKGLSKAPCTDLVVSSLEVMKGVSSICDPVFKGTLYHSVFDTAAKLADSSLMMKIFTQMQLDKVTPSPAVFRSLVQSLSSEGNVEQCNQIWQQMLAEDARPQPAVFMALLEAYLKVGQVQAALECFESVRKRDVDKGLLEESRSAFIRSLCRIGREPEASYLYQQAKTTGPTNVIDSTTGMLLAKMQADSGALGNAWTTLQDMAEHGNKPTEATISSFLNSCIKQSEGKYAKMMFNLTQSLSMSLSQATYASFIKLHGECGEVQNALAVYELMTINKGIEPMPQTAVSVMRVCFQCRWPEKAFLVLQQLKQMKRSPVDASVYRAAICGAASAGLLTTGIEYCEEALALGVKLPADAIDFIAGHCNADMKKRLSKVVEKHGYRM